MMDPDAVPGGEHVRSLVRICPSTAIAPRTPGLPPAATASGVSGRTPTTTRTMSAVPAQSVPPAPVRPPASRVIARTVAPVTTCILVGGGAPLAAQPAELRVDGGHHRRSLLDQG